MITLGAIGTFSSIPVFWPMPTARLSGVAAAAGIAVINAIGNLAGYLGPYAIGYFREATGSFACGLFAIGGTALLSAALVLALRPAARRVAVVG